MTEARLIVENFVDSMTHLMELLIKETSILNDKDFDGLNQPISQASAIACLRRRAKTTSGTERSVNCLTKKNVRICANYIKNLGRIVGKYDCPQRLPRCN